MKIGEMMLNLYCPALRNISYYKQLNGNYTIYASYNNLSAKPETTDTLVFRCA